MFGVLWSLISIAQPDVTVYYEKIEFGYKVYADSNEFCPVSVQLEFELNNVKSNDSINDFFIISPKKEKQLLTTLKIIKKSAPYGFSYEYTLKYGNIRQTTYDSEYPYFLPFKKNVTFVMSQGYMSTGSHRNMNAIDFTMPVGTPVSAIRDGVVLKVVEKFNKGCLQPECKKLNNFIIIYHEDGTFSEYDHIKQNGSIVEVGDQVIKGQIIAYSGNVGWSTGPHLHVMVYLQRLHTIETIETKFLIDEDSAPVFLIPKNKYRRDY